jgi:hypothetical protein
MFTTAVCCGNKLPNIKVIDSSLSFLSAYTAALPEAIASLYLYLASSLL